MKIRVEETNDNPEFNVADRRYLKRGGWRWKEEGRGGERVGLWGWEGEGGNVRERVTENDKEVTEVREERGEGEEREEREEQG